MKDLATFDDKLTMRHVREYPHPIDRVWDAVSTTEHLDVWLLPASQIERREGGRCSFSWGGSVHESMAGTVSIFDPPHTVKYEFPDGGSIQFNLEELDPDRTRLTFLQHFEPEKGLEPSDWPGGDQPAGPDSPWKPGFVGGFHAFLDQLGLYLSGDWTVEQARPLIDAVYAGQSGDEVWDQSPETRSPANSPERHGELIEIYREHIKQNCPR